MRIKDLLKLEAIKLNVAVNNKEDAIDKLVDLQDKAGNLSDVSGYKAAILKRESESTTAIGEGLAVPHAKTAAVKQPGLAAITVPDGVDYDAPDGQPSTLLFMIAAPAEGGDVHLEILSRLMVMLMDADFAQALRNAKTPKEFLDIINKQEAAKYPEVAEEEKEEAAPAEYRIRDLLKKEAIKLGVSVKDKEDAVDELVALQKKAGNVFDVCGYKAAILKRESESTTAIGDGIAVPHAKSSSVEQPGLAAMTVPAGVDYDAPDGMPSNLFFMIAAPAEGGDTHLEILSRLMVMLMDADFAQALRNAKTPEEFLDIINKEEDKKYPSAAEEKAEEAALAAAEKKEGYRILAVTACPTGIAHTYMAAEALDQAGKKLGYPVKVETNGSGGAKNVLTKEEIEAADGIIIAADKNVEMARFAGKPMVKVPVSDGINKPEELINRIIDGKAPVYKAEGGAAAAEETAADGESTWHVIYKHLMNGVSHMLPFVVGGGILIALAFLIDTIAISAAGKSIADIGSAFGTYNVAAAWLKTVGGGAMGFMLPVLAGFIAMSIADRPGLVAGFVGGYMANVGSVWSAPGGNEAGVSAGFIGALIAGFAAGYIVKGLQYITRNFPKSMDGIRPMLIYPLLGVAAIAVVMCTIDPLMIQLNIWISTFLTWLGGTNATVLLGLLLGLMMATDMGGPINKAAYLFGTAMLTTAATTTDAALQAICYKSMASVMIGGMVPPIAIALACTFFPQKFTKSERNTAATNYVMGLSFITEGAIPFAASDPGHVIPSMMVGSGIAGALSMLFGCTLMAPHGGIFVFATVGRWYLYLLALAIGAVAGMGMLVLLKKDVVSKEQVKAEKEAEKAEKAARKAAKAG